MMQIIPYNLNFSLPVHWCRRLFILLILSGVCITNRLRILVLEYRKHLAINSALSTHSRYGPSRLRRDWVSLCEHHCTSLPCPCERCRVSSTRCFDHWVIRGYHPLRKYRINYLNFYLNWVVLRYLQQRGVGKTCARQLGSLTISLISSWMLLFRFAVRGLLLSFVTSTKTKQFTGEKAARCMSFQACSSFNS